MIFQELYQARSTFPQYVESKNPGFARSEHFPVCPGNGRWKNDVSNRDDGIFLAVFRGKENVPIESGKAVGCSARRVEISPHESRFSKVFHITACLLRTLDIRPGAPRRHRCSGSRACTREGGRRRAGASPRLAPVEHRKNLYFSRGRGIIIRLFIKRLWFRP